VPTEISEMSCCSQGVSIERKGSPMGKNKSFVSKCIVLPATLAGRRFT